MENTRCVWREHSGYLRRGLHRATNGLINIKIIRSLPIGYFDTGKPQMPVMPFEYEQTHCGMPVSRIKKLWRKTWRAKVLTPWYDAQLKTQQSRNLGSTAKMQEARVITGWV